LREGGKAGVGDRRSVSSEGRGMDGDREGIKIR